MSLKISNTKKKKLFFLILIMCTTISITLTTVLAAKQPVLKDAELITNDNRHLIGKETLDEFYIVYRDGKYIDSNGNEILEDELLKSKQYSVLNNRIITQIDKKNFIPSSIVEFETKEKDGVFISPEIITKNGSVSILTNSNGGGWNLEPGDKVEYDYEKYKSEVIDNQKLLIGYVKDGIMSQGELFDQLKGKYVLSIKDSGKYYIFLLNASSDSISLKEGTLKFSKNN